MKRRKNITNSLAKAQPKANKHRPPTKQEVEWQKKNNPTANLSKELVEMRKKDTFRVMPVSDSPWAPTGFGTNTKNIAAIFAGEGIHVGYAGCQNPEHTPYDIDWPLGQTEKKEHIELLPILHPGQEKFGEKSMGDWIRNFQPNLIFTHLDVQMFAHIVEKKMPAGIQLPAMKPDGSKFTRLQRQDMVNDAYKRLYAGVPWKIGGIIPFDGQPAIPSWAPVFDNFDYPVAMSRYGKAVAAAEFPQLKEFNKKLTYIPHGVDTKFFKPKVIDRGHKAFVVGCVARNQHRKNIPRLIKGFAQFVKDNDLNPDQIKLLLHMQWDDYMGWDIDMMTKMYGVREYMYEPVMGSVDSNQALTEQEMVDKIYNHMDVFILPTGGEGFGIPSIEAMSCGVPCAITNYTTGYELTMMKNPDDLKEEIPLMPHGSESQNGRDYLDLEKDVSDRGIALPYKDMWWDTPKRAAPQRALVSEPAIAQAIELYYNNPQLKLEHGKNAREHMKKYYDWGPVGDKWRTWINNIRKEKK
mgnify:CR=1 FL=1